MRKPRSGAGPDGPPRGSGRRSSGRRRAGIVLGTLVAVLAALLGTSGAAFATGGASGGTGPRLTVPPAALLASVTCHGNPRQGAEPVLLVPGTTLDPDVNFDWNYERAFTARGQAWCAVRLPNHAMSDIQVSAEYVVAAVRGLHLVAGRKIDVVGFSQGGVIGRWALKFWPDTRGDVDDLVGIDPSNHGTLDAQAICQPGTGCAPAFWQQQTASKFITTLNAGQETYAGIDYTQIYSLDDEVVVPNLPPASSSSLTTGPGNKANIAVQSVCPAHVADHLSMGSIDPVGYALVIDAISHAGTANGARVDRSVCAAALMPGVDPATLPANEARYNGQTATVAATYPHVPAEPPLAAYARP